MCLVHEIPAASSIGGHAPNAEPSPHGFPPREIEKNKRSLSGISHVDADDGELEDERRSFSLTEANRLASGSPDSPERRPPAPTVLAEEAGLEFAKVVVVVLPSDSRGRFLK